MTLALPSPEAPWAFSPLHRRYVALAVCAAACLLFPGCQQQPDVGRAAQVYARWFVSPTVERRDTILGWNLDRAHLREIALRATGDQRGRPGPSSVRLPDIQGEEYTLGFTTPPTFSRDSLYPLVVYLHGGTMHSSSTKGETAYEMLAPLVDSVHAFLASPTATPTVLWWSPAGLGRILQAVRFMALHYPIDPNRIVLAGVSDGAAGCYAAANTICGPFAGFIAISGFGGMLSSAGVPLVPSNLMQRPIYNVNGAKDHLYPIALVKQFLDQLSQQGAGVLSTVYPDEDHGFDYRAKEFGTLAHYLRTWRRPTGRVSIAWRLIPGCGNNADNLVGSELAENAAGLPAINASWGSGRVVVRSLGVRAFVYEADRDSTPPVVVANGKAAERCRDVSDKAEWLLAAVQHDCVPVPTSKSLYRVAIDGQ